MSFIDLFNTVSVSSKNGGRKGDSKYNYTCKHFLDWCKNQSAKKYSLNSTSDKRHSMQNYLGQLVKKFAVIVATQSLTKEDINEFEKYISECMTEKTPIIGNFEIKGYCDDANAKLQELLQIANSKAAKKK